MKPEIRNPKLEGNPKPQWPKGPAAGAGSTRPFRISGLGFPSDFWFRISGFTPRPGGLPRTLQPMCGFAGVVVWDEKYRVNVDTLTRMATAVAHRGPDGQGLWLNHETVITPDHPQVGLAFRRLAILDPDPRSDQPFTDGRYWLVFNGEIYNFRELKKEITALRPGHIWRTTGDTEVLLAAYAQWGEKCVEKLNGMFAFAVWDEADKTLFLARDRMGQKPLYAVAAASGESFPATDLHMDEHGEFACVAFASEPSAVLSLFWVERQTDPTALPEYLRYGYTRWTLYGSIGAIEPAFSRTIRQTRVDDHQYFQPDGFPFSGRTQGGALTAATNTALRAAAKRVDADAVETTRNLVRRAVARQLVSDVPLGVFLSGGVDSSVIAACAARSGRVSTFSLDFGDSRYDETRHAVAVARHLGTDHHVFRVTPDAAIDLAKLAHVFGTPFADSSALPTHCLARETRKHVKVALSGDGGDELFGGYDRYRALAWGSRLKWLGWIGRLGPVLKRGHPKSRLTRIGRWLATVKLDPSDRYESYIRLFDEPAVRSLLAGPLVLDNRRTTFQVASLHGLFTSAGEGDVQAALAVDRITYLPDDLLVKVDRCSMLHGLEVRSPFMDHELVTFAAGLTTDQLLKGGPKRMLREAFADDLPAWVFKRKKMGFAVPIGDWFRGPLRAMLRESLFATAAFGRSHFDMKVVEKMVDDHESGRVDHSQRLYALLMLELWWDQNRTGGSW
jgi:asparagine synthase (glutamine-hydrolysing)